MATGKSTVGQLLAQALEFEFVDTDVHIEAEQGLSVAQIFEEQGESVFRAFEAELAQRLAGQSNLVIATGGGMLVDEANAAVLSQNGRIFCLTAKPAALLARLKAEGQNRPLLNVPDPAAKIDELLRARASHYAHFAQVATDNLSPEAIRDEILAALGH